MPRRYPKLYSALILLVTVPFLFASANAQERKLGIYLQAAPPALADTSIITNIQNTTGIYMFEGGLGYDILPILSVEATAAWGLYSEPYDAATLEFLGRLLYYPLGEKVYAPFIFIAAGGGTFEDETDLGAARQFLVGGGAGFAWFFQEMHGLVFRLSDIYHNTGSVDGHFNTMRAALLYRITF